jgi:uncharacterized FlaG/YvyC family protein
MPDSPLVSITGLSPGAVSRAGPSKERSVERKAAPAPQQTASLQSVVDAPHDVRLNFKIESGTNDITVVVVDKTTDRIIRTIPPDELRRLGEGSLIQLLT